MGAVVSTGMPSAVVGAGMPSAVVGAHLGKEIPYAARPSEAIRGNQRPSAPTWAKRSRTRLGPTPTNISMKSEPLME
jgi:hypothetical protein